MLSFALVYAGSFDGRTFVRPESYEEQFYAELRPISSRFQREALIVNGLDRDRLCVEGLDPKLAMNEASRWVKKISDGGTPVLVAYPVSFDWSWLYWYFSNFCDAGSPFGHSQCFDIKTALAIKANLPIGKAGRSRVPQLLKSTRAHTHHAIDDAISQAEIFANIFEWGGGSERTK